MANGLLRLTFALLVAVSLTACGVDGRPGWGCTDRDERVARALAALSVLQERPTGAEIMDEYSGCDTDDGFAYAGRQYRSSLDRDEVLAFYRTAATDHGWGSPEDDPPPRANNLVLTTARLCFTKQIDGVAAYLAVWFASDLNRPDAPPRGPDVFGLDLTGSHDGSAWC